MRKRCWLHFLAALCVAFASFAFLEIMTFTYSLPGINQAAQKAFEQSQGRKVWAVHGEMGAGKTTFIHAVCENLQVVSPVTSPTYAIINEYKTAAGESIFHLDLYRLKDEEEALQAGVEDVLTGGNLCMIEWADRTPALLPDDCFHVHITVKDENTRQLTITTA